MRKYLVTAILGVASLILVVAPALAGRQSSISLVLLARAATDAGAPGPQFGDQVTFDVSSNAARPQVNAECFQNGERVYSEWHAFFDGALGGRTFTLGPTPSWHGGAADCRARVVEWSSNGRDRTLASLSFHVGP